MAADTFMDYCLAILIFPMAASLLIFVGSTIIYCLADMFRGCYDHYRSKTTIVDEEQFGIRFEDDGKPRVTDFLHKKVYRIEHRPYESYAQLEAKGKHTIGLTCPICSNDFGNAGNVWVTIMPNCFHIFHKECISKFKSQKKNWLPFKFQKNYCCPSCRRVVNLKGLNEAKITSKPYNYKVMSNDGDVA